MLKEGQKAPDFSLPNSQGERIALKDFLGKKVIVYFYPKDDTPGCTKEACGFRDNHDAFLERGAVVLGISPDSSGSHQKFKDKFDLPFHLLSDEDHSVAEAFGAWGEKQTSGKTSMGMIRSTFVVDEEGVVTKVFPEVKPEAHADEILALI